MTIRTKLTLNAITVIVMISAVAATSFYGMKAIQGKLSYLTERSTPFQMRTLEFQRSLQGATTDLVKVGAARNLKDFAIYRTESDKSLQEVKGAQEVLESLAGGEKLGAYDELALIGRELVSVTEGRLKAEEGAAAANRNITTATRDAVARLKELDVRIKGLQQSRSTAYSGSVRDTQVLTGRVRDLEVVRLALKDIQLGLADIQKAKGKSAVLIAKGKVNAAVGKVLQNQYVAESKSLSSDIASLNERFDELVKASTAVAGKADADRSAADTVARDVSERLSSIQLMVEQEVVSASERYGEETGRQGNIFRQSNIATDILARNSELVAQGITVEVLASQLFAATSEEQIRDIETQLTRYFSSISSNAKSLDSLLVKGGATRERALLQRALQSLTTIQGALTASDGVITTIRNRLVMEAKATEATERLRQVVIAQAEKGKKTVSSAQGEQEKAIATVNKMVRTSTVLILAIGCGAIAFGILFGAWIYRSIARPLNELIDVSGRVAGGDLGCRLANDRTDEIGKVQAAMATMVGNLREMVGRIRGATENLANSSEELSATSTAMEAHSQEQSAQVEQSATAMTEMTQTTEEVARNSSETSVAATEMKKLAEAGRDAMNGTMLELEHFAGTVRESAQKVEAVGSQSEKIGDVVSLIKDIADQTNLLALNAAIEAARAGDQGRGFAVVADNVRQLAERTAEATDEISATVRTMHASIADSVGFMQQERDSVTKVLEHVGQTLAAIDTIVSYVEQVTDMVQRTAVAAEEQSATSAEISRAMDRITMITRELKSSFADIRSSSTDLARLATDLNGMVGWFKV